MFISMVKNSVLVVGYKKSFNYDVISVLVIIYCNYDIIVCV